MFTLFKAQYHRHLKRNVYQQHAFVSGEEQQIRGVSFLLINLALSIFLLACLWGCDSSSSRSEPQDNNNGGAQGDGGGTLGGYTGGQEGGEVQNDEEGGMEEGGNR